MSDFQNLIGRIIFELWLIQLENVIAANQQKIVDTLCANAISQGSQRV